MDDQDQFLLDELKKGHKTAYEQVFKKYYKALAIKAFLMLEDEMEAEDLVQNLFIAMWQKSHYSAIKTSLKAYLFRAVHNQCLMKLRKMKVDQHRLEVYTFSLSEDEEVDSEKYSQEDHISLIFNELPTQRQKAFKLVYLEDKKYKEAANEMGVSVNSVKTHLKLAIKMLQKKLIYFK
jgi:RNA polymerase sigma-70 factor (family 1)